MRMIEKTAYFYGVTGTNEEWEIMKSEYYSEFPINESLGFSFHGSAYNDGVNLFEDLVLTDLSVEILNYNYFEYKLSNLVNDFKKRFKLTDRLKF